MSKRLLLFHPCEPAIGRRCLQFSAWAALTDGKSVYGISGGASHEFRETCLSVFYESALQENVKNWTFQGRVRDFVGNTS